MTITTHEPDPDDAADDALAAERAGQSTTAEEHSDDVTTLAKVNDTPRSPADKTAATGEGADEVTVLARVNDNPARPRESETLTEVVIPEVAILDRDPDTESYADSAKAVLEDVGQDTGVRTPELDEATEPVQPTMIR
jgi:hypothetical protein